MEREWIFITREKRAEQRKNCEEIKIKDMFLWHVRMCVYDVHRTVRCEGMDEVKTSWTGEWMNEWGTNKLFVFFFRLSLLHKYAERSTNAHI